MARTQLEQKLVYLMKTRLEVDRKRLHDLNQQLHLAFWKKANIKRSQPSILLRKRETRGW